MADILPLPSASALVAATADPFMALPLWAREQAEQRLALLQAAKQGFHVEHSAATLYRWRAAYERGGLIALAPVYKGRTMKAQPWHAEAMRLGELPSKPNNGVIAFELRRQGFKVTVDQVRRYRQTLPSNRAETSPRALGANHYKLTHTPYVIRDWSGVPVGYQYEADGHSCDFYIEHPATGSPFKPELTFWLDLRSQYVVDFWVSGFENAFDIRMSLSRALLKWNHVPHEIHADCGAYRAKVMADEATGFCTKLGMQPHFAIARNARSKPVEGEWRLFTDRCARIRFAETYVHDRTDDGFRQFRSHWNKGDIRHVTLRECYDIIAEYVEQRNHEHRPNLLAADGTQGATPAEVWATLKRNPVEAPAAAIVRPRAKRSVRNRRVRIDHRVYEAAGLMAYESRTVVVEYDDWHDEQVWIYDDSGRFLFVAPLVRKRAALPPSRIAERMQAQRAGRLKRLELQKAEVEGQSAAILSPASMLDVLEHPAAPRAVAGPERLLTQGYNLGVPAPAALAPPVIEQPIAPRALESFRAEVARDEQDAAQEETPAQRFQRARALQAREAAGEALAEPDRQWLSIYVTTPEFHSRLALAEEFGATTERN